MSIIIFLFGLVLGLVISIALVLASVYNLLYHTMPEGELRLFMKEIRTALRSFNRRKNRR